MSNTEQRRPGWYWTLHKSFADWRPAKWRGNKWVLDGYDFEDSDFREIAPYPIARYEESVADLSGDVEIPESFIKYLKDAWYNISAEGEVARFATYGGSTFVIFKNKRCYRLNISGYNDNTMTTDEL